MISNSDIAKLAKVLSTKEDVIDIYERLDRLDTTTGLLLTSVDNLAKAVRDLKTEYISISDLLKKISKS